MSPKINTEIEVNNTIPERPPLCHAADTGDIDTVKQLIREGDHLHCQEAFIDAISRNHAEIAKLLIEVGADVNFRDNEEYAPFYWCGGVEAAKVLIEAGADINYATDHTTPLHEAIETNQYGLAKFLIELGVETDRQNVNGETALDIARRLKRSEMINLLTNPNTHMVA